MRRQETKQGPKARRQSGCKLLALLCGALLLPVLAQAADPLQGRWEGSLSLPGGETMPVVLRLDQSGDGNWGGHVLATTAEGEDISLRSLSISGSAISFRFQSPNLPAAVFFSGNYQSWDDALKGVFVMSGQSLPIRFSRFVETPTPGAGELALPESDEVPTGFRRHVGHFGISGRGSYAYPIYVIREDTRNINDITTSSSSWSAGARWYIMDAFALFGRYYSGGLAFRTNDANLALFGFTGDEFLEMSGIEGGFNIYIGNSLLGDSKFNPYVTFAVGKLDWSVGMDGRGSEVFAILEEPVAGNDFTIGAGLGTEYPLSNHLVFEFEWYWRYVFTEDDTRWDDVVNQWTNTHLWDMSFGLVINF